jgi:polyisoprenoid-binding protein YceI
VWIDVASLKTHNTQRDEHLRTGEFFDTVNHPHITFRSTAVERLGHDRFRPTGDLTVKGHSRPVIIDFTHTGVAKDPYGNTRAGFEGQATLNRKDWGLTWNAPLESGGVLISDKITLELDIAAVKADARQ